MISNDRPTNASDPAYQDVAVTPNDTEDSAHSLLIGKTPPRALWIGVGGDVKVHLVGSSAAVVYKNVPSGSILPVRAQYVWSTGTTATNIVAMY
jgi:hypothetical protein